MIWIDTDRLVLRTFRPDDWVQLQALAVAYQASDEARFEPPWPTAEDDVKGLASWFAGGDDYLAVCLEPAGTLIGMVAIEPRADRAGARNLGYVFHPGYGGKGYATEACRAAMTYLFDTLGIALIVTGTHPDNARSVRLLERLGLHAIANGEWALSREEWQVANPPPDPRQLASSRDDWDARSR